MITMIKMIILSLLLLTGCHRHTHSSQLKMNAELRHQVCEQTDSIHFSGECRSDITSQIRLQLEKTGITIKNVKGSIFTAKGTSGQIRKLSKLDIIVRLESPTPYQYKSKKEKMR